MAMYPKKPNVPVGAAAAIIAKANADKKFPFAKKDNKNDSPAKEAQEKKQGIKS